MAHGVFTVVNSVAYLHNVKNTNANISTQRHYYEDEQIRQAFSLIENRVYTSQLR